MLVNRCHSNPANPTKLRRELSWLFVANTVVSAVLFLGFILGIPTGLRGAGLMALPAAIISQAAFLHLGLLGIATGITWLKPQSLAARWSVAVLFSLAQVALLADVALFRLFRRHFDGMIWNVLTTPGAGDTVQAGTATVVTAGTVLFLVFFAGLFLARGIVPRLVRFSPVVPLGIVIACMLWERTTFAILDLRRSPDIQLVRDALPLYQPLTFKGLARKLGWKPPPPEPNPLRAVHSLVTLPRHPLREANTRRQPNILVAVVEGGRADALTAKAMPHLNALAQDAFLLRKHFSTGNETRFGIFGLLYGIPGTYWQAILTQRQGPPWLHFLAAQGYAVTILSCTDLNYPEFRQTAFVEFPEAITDHWDGPRIERDERMMDRFVGFLKERARQPEAAHPFFGFLFFDASHQPYHYPAADGVFSSSLKRGEINYSKLAFSSHSGAELKKHYLNSLHYVDRQLQRGIDALRHYGEYRSHRFGCGG